jgi:hypothetical protein
MQATSGLGAATPAPVERPIHVREIVALSIPAGRGRAVVYWISTAILATECIVGGVMGALRMPPSSRSSVTSATRPTS